ncbi:MAG: topoisomerase IV, partial [Oscillospiraceae bacterium]
VITDNYSGFMMFFFLNGRVSKVALLSYRTKTNRRKLVAAYTNKFDLCKIIHVPEDCEILMRSSSSRMLLLHTGALQQKQSRDNGGVAVMTQKKGQHLLDAIVYEEGMLQKPHRYRTRTLPAAGSLPSSDENKAEQLT